MKKLANCDQCGKRNLLSNKFESIFHRHFKYKDFPILIKGTFSNPFHPELDEYLCKVCRTDAIRAMQNGENWE